MTHDQIVEFILAAIYVQLFIASVYVRWIYLRIRYPQDGKLEAEWDKMWKHPFSES